MGHALLLPDDCWLRIFSFVPPEDLRGNIVLVCKQWRRAIFQPRPQLKIFGDVKLNVAASEFALEGAGLERLRCILRRLPGVRKIKLFRGLVGNAADEELCQQSFYREVFPQMFEELRANHVDVEMEVFAGSLILNDGWGFDKDWYFASLSTCIVSLTLLGWGITFEKLSELSKLPRLENLEILPVTELPAGARVCAAQLIRL
ncbi:hypothetical protein COCOBI_18-2520 [Coccomyxa sp. Obi]|nr:hypothetical protein COCOBI_18-2520 [Coccomyxa sp. Obi]